MKEPRQFQFHSMDGGLHEVEIPEMDSKEFKLQKQVDLLVLGLLQEKRLTSAFSTFVDSVKKETHSMSFEKMHPTLKMLFNHLLTSLRFAEEALNP